MECAVLTRCEFYIDEWSYFCINALLRNIEDMEYCEIGKSWMMNEFWQVLFRIILLKRVQGEPAGKILISDLPTGGSADHVDQRGV